MGTYVLTAKILQYIRESNNSNILVRSCKREETGQTQSWKECSKNLFHNVAKALCMFVLSLNICNVK